MSYPTSAQFSTALGWAGIALLSYLLYLVVQPFLIPLVSAMALVTSYADSVPDESDTGSG